MSDESILGGTIILMVLAFAIAVYLRKKRPEHPDAAKELEDQQW
ncbi:PEP-CTERM protein-sorting domain-containing protein [Rhodoferax sp. OV413]|nr:hypothetical protein [Rhodoferax sp. OV413]SDO76912.1 PEP-CTERM protein-sorting domain-containing protein [Rhodoferax sp. OV413]